MMTIKKLNFFQRRLSPAIQCWIGIFLLCVFLLIEGLLLKAILTGIFALLARINGKRIRWLYFCIICIACIVFQLLHPVGKVILALGPITITDIALRLGMEKGITLSGMVFISLFAIRKDLRIPGKLGGLLMLTLRNFESLVEERKTLRLRHLFQDIDALLLTLYRRARTDD